MVLGLPMTTFTLFHVGVSLLALIAGLVVVGGLSASARLDGWTGLFLATTFLTNATGFFFPTPGFLPSHAVGALSLVLLPFVLWARYRAGLAGGWRRAYVVGATTLLYFNFFVLIAQVFPPAAGAHRPRAEAAGAAVPAHPTRLPGGLHLARACRGEGVPSPAGELNPVFVSQPGKGAGLPG